jgi:diguanylate cyclase (GGDEF)-like protein
MEQMQAGIGHWCALAALLATTWCTPLAAAEPAATPPVAAAPAAPLPVGRITSRSYGAELGLANVGVLRLLQDRTGFIWAGTEDGLYRYDGYRFDGFGLKEGLQSTSIDALFEDPAGVLWVGTHAGLSWYDGQRFVPVKASSGLPEITINGIAPGPGGLCVTTAQGPYLGNARSQFRPMEKWPGGEATAVLAAAGASPLWMARWNGDAEMLAFKDGTWQSFAPPEGRPKERIEAIARDADGRIWARTPTSLWLLSADGAQFDLVPTPIPLVSSRGYLATGARGDLYVPTDRGLLHRSGQQWQILTPERGLPGAPWPILEDREGSLWIGSVGLHRVLGRGVFHAFTTAEGLPYDVVWNVFRDREQRLLVGTAHGLGVAEGTGFRTLAGTENNTIRSIVQAADGTIYLAGVPGNEVLSITPSTGLLVRHELSPNNPAKRIFRLLMGRDGTLWASTDGAGLWRADTAVAPLRFVQVAVPGGTSDEYMSDVREDDQGRVWVAGQKGVAVLDQGVWRRFTMRDGLRSNVVAYVRPLRNGDVLLPYFDPFGIARVLYEHQKLRVITHYDATSTHTADKVFSVGEDALGRIWIGGGKGIDLLTPEGSRHFGAAEGLIGEDNASMAFLADQNGDAWFGTTKGLVRFDQKAYAALPGQQPPVTSLIRILLDGKSYPANASGIKVERDNTFEIRFAGISFIGEGSIEYRERLVGREVSFNITDSRDARYSALEHGNYRFEVAARIGPHGAWGPVSTFAFEVMPAWWQTWWFRTVAALGAVLLLAAAYRWRMALMRRENLRLEGLVAARTDDLQQANAALQESSMVDPLTGLKNRRYLNAFMPEELARTMRQQRAASDRNIDLCVLMVDLDHFKMVNDQHGHNAGDNVLRQVADVVRSACRASDVVVRWGGEEFLIVARNIDRNQAPILAGQICDAVRAHHFDLGNGVVLRKTCSLGYTAFPVLPTEPERYDWEQALELADQCMYAAKATARDGWVGCLVQPAGDLTEGMQQIPGYGPAIVISSWAGSRTLVWKNETPRIGGSTHGTTITTT